MRLFALSSCRFPHEAPSGSVPFPILELLWVQDEPGFKNLASLRTEFELEFAPTLVYVRAQRPPPGRASLHRTGHAELMRRAFAPRSSCESVLSVTNSLPPTRSPRGLGWVGRVLARFPISLLHNRHDLGCSWRSDLAACCAGRMRSCIALLPTGPAR